MFLVFLVRVDGFCAISIPAVLSFCSPKRTILIYFNRFGSVLPELVLFEPIWTKTARNYRKAAELSDSGLKGRVWSCKGAYLGFWAGLGCLELSERISVILDSYWPALAVSSCLG